MPKKNMLLLRLGSLPMTGVPQFAAIEPKYMQTMHTIILLFVSSPCFNGIQTHTNLKK